MIGHFSPTASVERTLLSSRVLESKDSYQGIALAMPEALRNRRPFRDETRIRGAGPAVLQYGMGCPHPWHFHGWAEENALWHVPLVTAKSSRSCYMVPMTTNLHLCCVETVSPPR